MRVVRKTGQQTRLKRRIGQRHVDDVHGQQLGLAGVETALEHVQVGDALGRDAQRLGGQQGEGLDRVRRRDAVFVGFGRRVGRAAVFGRHVGQRELEFGESDHGEEGLCLSSKGSLLSSKPRPALWSTRLLVGGLNKSG
ncbi:hypothetical protein D9M69_569100 [compost metagenome]